MFITSFVASLIKKQVGQDGHAILTPSDNGGIVKITLKRLGKLFEVGLIPWPRGISGRFCHTTSGAINP